MTAPKATAQAVSTSGYRAEMRAPQCRQRPRSATHDTMGTSSAALSSLEHDGQCDGGATIDSPRGTRHSTTLRNDPINAPSTKANTTTSAGGTATVWSVR